MARQPSNAVLHLAGSSGSELPQDEVRRLELGDLVLPSGRIIVSDPTPGLIGEPLERRVGPGSYPVLVFAIEHWNAFAVLRFSNAGVTRWEFARSEREELGYSLGCSVDSGFAGFMDADTRVLVERRHELAQGDPEYFGYVMDVLMDGFVDEQAGIHTPIEGDPRNVAAFASGLGDGLYPVLWGLDDTGAPAVLLCDFQVIRDPGDMTAAPE